MKLTESEYHAHCRDMDGYCSACDKVTGECVEPDAEGYECPVCTMLNVMGMEQALICGYLSFKKE